MGHLILEIFRVIFDVLMGFIAFGSVAVLFASLIGLAIWFVSKLWNSD